MDLSLIQSFVAVAEEKSFSSAARHLFISQQSLSKQIARLEEELGAPLLVRSRPLNLTAEGKLFLQTAKGMLKLKEQYDEASQQSRISGRIINLGIEHTIARAILPRLLPEYISRHGDTFVKITEDSPERREKAVSREGVDIVIGSIKNPPPSYKTIHLCRKRQLLVVPKKMLRELAGDDYEQVKAEFAKRADLRYFESCPFIRLSRESSGGRSLISYMKYYGISPRFVCELTNVENAFQLANSGLGAFIYASIFWDMIDPELREDYLKHVDVFRLPYLPDIDDVCAYYHKDQELKGGAPELLEMIVEFFKDYESKGG